MSYMALRAIQFCLNIRGGGGGGLEKERMLLADSTKRGEEGRSKLNAFYFRLLIHLWLWFMLLSFLTMLINYHIKIIRFWLVYVFFFNFFVFRLSENASHKMSHIYYHKVRVTAVTKKRTRTWCLVVSLYS